MLSISPYTIVPWPIVFSLFAAQFQRFHISLQKWFSMDFVALLFVDHVNFVSSSYLTRMSCCSHLSRMHQYLCPFYFFNYFIFLAVKFILLIFKCWKEMMFCWDDYDRREILEETAPHLVDSICVYRAGYVAEVCYF